MKRLKYLLFFLFFFSTAFSQEKIKVACIGNSITYGTGLSEEEREKMSYPMQLKALLNTHFVGKSFDVRNFGVPGSTVLKRSTLSYWNPDVNNGQYQAAKDFNPDIVIIKFGTNDAGATNWTGRYNGKSLFYENYVEFLNSIKDLTSKPIIYICFPIPLYRDLTTDQSKVLREEVIPLIKQVARKNDVQLIDLHSVFYDGVTRGLIIEKTSDDKVEKVHPTVEGATLIAQEVFKMIKMTYNPN